MYLALKVNLAVSFYLLRISPDFFELSYIFLCRVFIIFEKQISFDIQGCSIMFREEQ